MHNHVVWPMAIVIYLFLAGIAGGAFYSGALAEFYSGGKYRRLSKWGTYLSLPLILIGVLMLIFDLGRSPYFWHIILKDNFTPLVVWSSTMSVGTWFLTIFGALSFIILLFWLSEEEKTKDWPIINRFKGKDSVRKFLTFINMIVGMLVAAYTGILLASTSVPMWHATPFLGLLFACSATSTGLAALMLCHKAANDPDEEMLHLLGKADMDVIFLELAAFALLLLGLGAFAPEAGLKALITGPYGIAFWVGIIICGLILPLAVEIYVNKFPTLTVGLTTLAAVLVLVGGFLVRYVIIYAGQIAWRA